VLELSVSGPDMPLQIVPDNMFFRPVDCAPVYDPVPGVPTNLTTTEVAGNIVRVEWEGDTAMKGLHTIEISPIGWSTSDRLKEVQRIPAEQNSYVFINIEPGTTYELRLRSLGAAGYSPYSSEVSFRTVSPPTEKPAPPDRLQASLVRGTALGLRWRDNASDEQLFVVEAKMGNEDYAEITTTDRNISDVLIEELAAGKIYSFRVAAANEAGILAYSNELEVAIPTAEIPFPGIRVARPVQGNGLLLSFPSNDGALYQVEHAEGLEADGWTDWGDVQVGDGSVLEIEVEGPQDGPVFYRVDVTGP